MEMIVDFPGGARVDAHFGPYTVQTDQPPAGGGEGSAPTPFAMFLAAIGACAGIYVLGFCRQRNLRNPATGMVEKIDLEIQVPPNFPRQYYEALVRSAELCAVKKHLQTPPAFNIYTRAIEGSDSNDNITV